jgi:hypothetical protein
MQCARTSGLQYSSTMGSGLARFSTKPVHTVAPLVNGRGDQIVANGVGQTAVDGAPATCGSLSLMADEAAGRCDSQTPRVVSGCSMPCNGNAGDGQRRFRVEMRTPHSLCLGRVIRSRIPAQPIYHARRRCAFRTEALRRRNRDP